MHIYDNIHGLNKKQKLKELKALLEEQQLQTKHWIIFKTDGIRSSESF